QNIVLAGQQDVIAGLNSIGKAGVDAFEAIGKAAESSSIVGTLTEVLAGAALAFGGLVAGAFEWVNAAANSTVQMANFAHETGSTTAEMTTMITSLNNAGNQTENLTVAFRRLAVAVESVWPEIQKSVRNAANVIKADTLGVQQALLSQ